MKTVTITNQKGGTGKTSTALALGAALKTKGYKVLMIDMDAQGNMSYTINAKTNGATVLGVLTNEVKIADAIQTTENGDVIASSKALSGADAIICDTGKEYRLREALESISKKYDYCIIDTPPALGILTINALTASDSVIIPAQADIYSIQGIEQLAETIKPVKKYCNPKLEIEGILLTRYSPRAVLSREVSDLAGKLAESIGTKLFNTAIREAITVKEAEISRRSLFDYAPKSGVAEDYMNFTEEFLQRK